MFDDPKTPTNLPTGSAPEPEDMFAKVEPAPSPQPSPAVGEVAKGVPTPEGGEFPVEIKAPLISSRKTIIIGGAVLGALVIAGVVFGAMRFVRRAAVITPSVPEAPAEEGALMPEIPTLPAAPENASEENEVVSEEGAPEEAPATAVSPTSPAPLDSDNDGLSNDDEAKQGSDPNNPDSDNDGLFDGEEVKTYQTDPLNADTDGDTYQDGQEVRGGYNPKGAGKLFTVPAQ